MSLIDLASLVLAPTATKEGKVYSAIPNTGDGDMTFSRGSAATRVNSAGLIEKERTNLALYSEQFDNAAWTKTNTSVTANSVTSPDGTQNADTITSTAALPNILSPLAAFASTTNVSIFVKYVSQQWVQLMSGGAVNAYANFDIQNGVIGTVGSNASNAQIENLGNGWYRISVNLLGFTGNTNLYFGFVASGTAGWNTFDPNFNKSLYAWGAQIETGDIATEYIPTTSSAVSVGITDDVPRVDYSGGGCPSLLLEGQRSNLVTDSEYFGGYSNFGSADTANQETSPEGVVNATLIEGDGSQSQIYTATPIITVPSAGDYTLSIFAKKGTEQYIILYLDGFTGSSNSSAYFDLYNGTTPTSGASIEDYGNGWYRCYITATINVGDLTGRLAFNVTPSTSTVFYGSAAAADGKNIYTYGAMLEAGDYPTSYIPTYGASSTRSEDESYNSSATFLEQNQGTLLIEFNRIGESGASFENAFFISDGTLNNFVNIVLDISASRYKAQVRSGGSTSGVVTAASAYSGNLKIALAFSSNDLVMYINGDLQGTDTSVTLPSNTLDRIGLGGYYTASYGDTLRAKYKQALYFPTRLTNDELASLTTI